jgi:hypothetical protein
MNIRILLIGAAFAGVLGSVGVNAQVLGGGLVGGAGGALSGGLNDLRVIGAGSTAGSFDAGLEASTLRRSTRDVAEQGVGRVRGVARNVRDRADSAVSDARGAAHSAATDAAASAREAADPQRVAGAAQLAGAAAVSASGDGAELVSVAKGGTQAHTAAVPGTDSATAPDALSLPAAPMLSPPLNASGAGATDADVSSDGALARSSFTGRTDADASVSK